MRLFYQHKLSKWYRSFVHDFTNVTNRIELGKQMAIILYNSEVHTTLLNFALKTEHTGSRHDCENFLNINLPTGTLLRLIYPAITHQKSSK